MAAARAPYTVRQEKFEGPLDVLLELIQDKKLSVNEISLAKVTDEFVAYLKTIEAGSTSDREALAEFLVIAATLLLIKSRSLLPQFAVSPEEEVAGTELTRRLEEYRRVRELAASLGQLARGGQKSFSREAFSGQAPIFYPPRGLTARMLASAFSALLRAIAKAPKLAEETVRKIISLEEKIRELEGLLAAKVERAFSELVAGAKEKVEVIVSFLAVLELARQKLVLVEQKDAFGDITVRRAGSA